MLTYSTLDAAGEPVAIADREPFTTWWVKVADAQEAAYSLGYAVGEYAPCVVRHPPTALARYDAAALERYRITAEEVADPPPVVPAEVARWRGLLALEAAGMLAAVKALVAASQDPAVDILFNHRDTWRRDSPVLLGLAAQMSPPLTSEQIDALFIAAELAV